MTLYWIACLYVYMQAYAYSDAFLSEFEVFFGLCIVLYKDILELLLLGSISKTERGKEKEKELGVVWKHEHTVHHIRIQFSLWNYVL